MTEGVPQFRLFYKGTTVRPSRRAPCVRLAQPGKENMLSLLSLPVMPEAFWRNHKLSDPLSTPPLASGYRITDWRMGQYIIYSRVKDYWAADLPVNRGRWNFDTLRYDYYLDDNVAFEAFKAGAVDRRAETSPKTGRPAMSDAILPTAISLKMSTRTPRRRIPNGWHSISSARCLTTAGSVKPSPSPSILNG
jgi:hypothetical protein